MTYQAKVYPDLSLGIVWLKDVVTVVEWIGALEGLYGNNTWKPGYATLWDLRGVTQLVLGPGDMDALMERVDALKIVRGKGRIAFVVSRDLEEAIAMLYILRQRGSGRRGKVFWSPQSAFDWLGISSPPIEAVRGVWHA